MGELGEGSYAVRFVRRRTLLGPAHPIGELPAVSGSWARQISTTTDGQVSVVLGGPDGEAARMLRQLDPWRTELELWREPGGEVWTGPVQDVIADPDGGTATITAKDLSAWWGFRLFLASVVSRGEDLADIFARYVAIAAAADDPGILIATSPTGILGSRTIAAGDLKVVADELAEVSRTGVDWTMTARTAWVGGLTVSASRFPGRLVDEHFRKAPQTRRSGSGMVTDSWVRANNGIRGHHGGPDPSDGVLLQGVVDGSSIEDQASADAAARSRWDRASQPLHYVEGENALAASAPVDVQELIPGLLTAVSLSGGGAVPVEGDQRLESVKGQFGADGETVTVALQPAGTIGDGEG